MKQQKLYSNLKTHITPRIKQITDDGLGYKWIDGNPVSVTFDVFIDIDAIMSMGRIAAHNKTRTSRDGALVVKARRNEQREK